VPLNNKTKLSLLTATGLTVLILLTLFTYASSLTSGLVDWDDQFQVTQNLDIKQLDWHNLQKMFSSFYLGMYQPLATLSFALENKFFRAWPLFLHLDNVLLHIINLLLVYWLTWKLFKRRSLALIAAALFAVHPLNVESVAWVSARSNLLFSAFALGALIAYTFYLTNKKWGAYVLTLALFILSLLSKVAAVALPVVLLLFDYYEGRRLTKKVWLEKLPFFALSLVFGWVAIASRGVTALVPAIHYSLWQKLLFIPYSYLFYLSKLILPIKLSAYYPFPQLTNGWLSPLFYISAAILALLIWALWHWRKHKTVVFLFLFYACWLAPTLQIKDFSTTITADRYVYLAGLAYYWLAALAFTKLYQKFKHLKLVLIASLVLFIILLACLAKIRTWAWADDMSLWTDIAQQNPQLPHVYINLGNAEKTAGNNDQAMAYYQKALAQDPHDPFVYSNIGSLLANNLGQHQKAIDYYNQAIKLNSQEALFYYNRACSFLALKQNSPALADYQRAVDLSNSDEPYYYVYLESLANTQYQLTLLPAAVANYDQVIKLYEAPEAYFYRGLAKIKLDQKTAGCQDLVQADKLGYKDAQKAIIEQCQ
jgi:tetratricopeptide (TPR) repeat protein